MSVEELLDLPDRVRIGFLRLIADAWSSTFVDVILQTNLILAGFDGFGGKVQAARSDLENHPDRLKHDLHAFDIRIRAEVFGAVSPNPPGWENSWERFVFYTDVRIRFVIAEADIVARLEFLDQVVFEDECFSLSIGDDDFDVPNFADQNAQTSFSGAAFLEIRANSIA